MLGYKLEKEEKEDLLQNTLALIHHLAHCHSSQSATAGCLNHPWASLPPTSPFSISLSLALIPFPLLYFDIFLLRPFLLLSILYPTLLLFLCPYVPLPPPPQPLLIPVCYPSSPCRQRSLTTDSLLPFLLPNPYTTSRYWLHAELPGARPPPFPRLSLLPPPSSFSVNDEASVQPPSRFWLSDWLALPALHYIGVAH